MRNGLGRRRAAGAFMAAAVLLAALARPPQASGQPEYSLYYRFDVPTAVLGFTASDDGTKRTYTGALRGTLGGIPVTDGRYTYSSAAGSHVGAGTFSMTTPAAPVRDGQILMTNDGKQTALLFLGTYLGAHVSFSIVGAGEQVGGPGVTAEGLAETNFLSHDRYMSAIQQATAGLPQEFRSRTIVQASENPKLVREYQQRSAPR